jgi:hypothetical protein
MLRKVNNLYVRTVREVDMAVLGVGDNGQKRFYDPISGGSLPYITGQQVKHCVINQVLYNLGISPAEMTIVHRPDSHGKIKEGEIFFEDPNPAHAEILLRGHFKNVKRIKNEEESKKKRRKNGDESDSEGDSEDNDTTIYKRRSPLSHSPLIPFNSKLASLPTSKGAVCVDRSSSAQFHKLVLDDGVRPILFDDVDNEEIRNRMKPRKYDGGMKSFVHGILSNDVAIDMDRLYAVSLQRQEPEVSQEVINKLRAGGWVDIFHRQIGEMLYLPKDSQMEITESLSDGLVNWRVTTNQSQHFSLMNNIAVIVSTNANEIKSCMIPVFSKNERDKDILVNFDIEETEHTKVFVSKSIKATTPKFNGSCSVGAMDAARDYIFSHISSYEIGK